MKKKVPSCPFLTHPAATPETEFCLKSGLGCACRYVKTSQAG